MDLVFLRTPERRREWVCGGVGLWGSGSVGEWSLWGSGSISSPHCITIKTWLLFSPTLGWGWGGNSERAVGPEIICTVTSRRLKPLKKKRGGGGWLWFSVSLNLPQVSGPVMFVEDGSWWTQRSRHIVLTPQFTEPLPPAAPAGRPVEQSETLSSELLPGEMTRRRSQIEARCCKFKKEPKRPSIHF